MLQKLFDYVGMEEENNQTDHSFTPQEWPDNVCQAPLTEEEEIPVKEAYSRRDRMRALPRTRKFLPCHYFDYVCGSSTGA